MKLWGKSPPPTPTFLSRALLEVGAAGGFITAVLAALGVQGAVRSGLARRSVRSPVPLKFFVETLIGPSCKEPRD